MQYLLHEDLCLKTLQTHDFTFLERARKAGVECWVPAAGVGPLLFRLSESMESHLARGALKEFLSQVTLLHLTGLEICGLLDTTDGNYTNDLTVLAVQKSGLAGVVTLKPDVFANSGIHAVRPQDLEKYWSAEAKSAPKVPLLNIPATYPQILPDAEQGLFDVIRSGHFILGPKVTELEEQCAAYCQTEYAVGVSSGTDALLIALMAVDIGPGDEVITTPYTFFATAGSIARTGARPVMVDIDPVTFNIDPERIEAAITPATKAIMPVHLYGQCADMEPILTIAEKHRLTVIEDAAQAIGAEYKGKRAGSLGHFGCFSFFPTKNLGGFGDAGLVTTSSPEMYERLRILRVHGMEPKYYHKWVGGNFRIDALQAAVIRAKLPFLEGWTARRRENAARYNLLFKKNGVAECLTLPNEVFSRHIYNQYVVRVGGGRRDALRQYLAEHNVMSEVYYPVPLHLQECFKPLGYTPGAFPISEQAAHETLALPIANEITAEQQEHVAEVIRKFFS